MPATEHFTFVGRIHPLTGEEDLLVQQLPGRVPRVLICEESGSMHLSYFPSDSQPVLGSRVGVVATWLRATRPMRPCELAILGVSLPGMNLVEYQLEVNSWQRVSADFDVLYDPIPIRRAG